LSTSPAGVLTTPRIPPRGHPRQISSTLPLKPICLVNRVPRVLQVPLGFLVSLEFNRISYESSCGFPPLFPLGPRGLCTQYFHWSLVREELRHVHRSGPVVILFPELSCTCTRQNLPPTFVPRFAESTLPLSSPQLHIQKSHLLQLSSHQSFLTDNAPKWCTLVHYLHCQVPLRFLVDSLDFRGSEVSQALA
jgi:hypothetical protein